MGIDTVRRPATLILDLETVPDILALRRLLRADPDVSDSEVLSLWEARRNAERPDTRPVLKPGLQQIVAIAAAWIDPGGALRRLAALGDPSWDEAALVRECLRIISEGRPQIAGWNTGGFDLPVLIYRALVHRIPAPAFYAIGEPGHGYRRRYDEAGHVDLMDVLSGYGAGPRLSLDEMAAVLGIPGKGAMNGADVYDAWQAGRIDEIRQYCEEDVLTTALVYARYAEHRGWWDETAATTFANSVAAFLRSAPGSHWERFRSWVADSRVVGGPGSWTPNASA
jgi:predicted PolB exonuclease-like 3'-5' exonuclease